jgi:hypothetical protein
VFSIYEIAFKLHSGSIYLYVRDGRVRVLADMNIDNECRERLKNNIGFFIGCLMFLGVVVMIW